ncbi:MAG: S1C family serine protease [bacterium]|nr:S1C family serine protease [bacterium]
MSKRKRKKYERMKSDKILICVSLIIFYMIMSVSYAELTTSQIANEYSASVVTIVALDENDQPLSLGSGFFISSDGEIATNHHVLEGCSKAIIKTTKGDRGDIIEIIKDDPVLDLLVAKTSLKNTKPLPLGDSDILVAGEDIVAIGNPAGLEGTISKGIISGIRKSGVVKFIQITAPISPGSSGGPVFNLKGKVIGIATAYLDVGQNLNFAMPINYLKLLDSKKIQLNALQKAASSKDIENASQIEATQIYYNQCDDGTSLCSIDFVLKNNSNYLIKNIKLLFIYKTHHKEYPEEYNNYNLSYDERQKIKPTKEWDEVVSYSASTIGKTILPNLALQFSHEHVVKHYMYKNQFNTFETRGYVEIRVLDYDIERSAGSSTIDLLLK